MNSIRGLSNEGLSEMVQWFDTRRLSSGLLFGGLSKCVKYSKGCLISKVKGIWPCCLLVYCNRISNLDVGFRITQIGPLQPKL